MTSQCFTNTVNCIEFDHDLIKSVVTTIGDSQYRIASYDAANKSALTQKQSKYRSVVVVETHALFLPVGFSLPRSIPADEFIARNPMMSAQLIDGSSIEFLPENVVITEHIEGTMINLFYDPVNELWEIATKTRIGASYVYYTDTLNPTPTFREMFLEAIGLKGHDLAEWELLEHLPKNWSYSFVLQHPDNHIAICCDADVYLVAAFEKTMISQTHAFRYIPQSVFQPFISALPWKYAVFPFKFPNVYTQNMSTFQLSEMNAWNKYYTHTPSSNPLMQTYESIKMYFEMQTDGWLNVGCMLINTVTGDRTKFTNKRYLAIRKIRGNHPNLRFQYCDLMKNQQDAKFMFYFPRYQSQFAVFDQELSAYVQTLYHIYMQRYVAKNVDGPIPAAYNRIIHRIHDEICVAHSFHAVTMSDINRFVVIQQNVGVLFSLMKKHLEYVHANRV
jgi:hypothetical protein